jgi:hypothetical protein
MTLLEATKRIPWNKGLHTGITPWLGKTHSQESRLKMRLAKLAKPSARKGLPLSIAHKHALSLAKLGKPSVVKGKHWKLSIAARINIGNGHRGPKHYRWRGGITHARMTVRERFMRTMPYRLWRQTVFARDDYRCYDCGTRGARLEADHVFPYRDYPRLRLDTNNGITRCHSCHVNRHRKIQTTISIS